MQIYFRNLLLFFIFISCVSIVAAQTAKSYRGNPVCDKPETLAYENLAAFVNDSDRRLTGECVVVENVPVFSEIKNAEDEFGNRKGLFYLETASQSDVGDTFITSNSISDHLGALLKNPSAKSLRVTAFLVEMRGEFDIFRAPYAVKVEGLDENDRVVWTASGTTPAKLMFQV